MARNKVREIGVKQLLSMDDVHRLREVVQGDRVYIKEYGKGKECIKKEKRDRQIGVNLTSMPL